MPDPLPRDFESLKASIVARAPDLPKRLTQVAAYALRHPDEMAFGTAASIAGAADVQPSTLVRFSQAMGYQGFSELQEVFRSRLRGRVPDYGERMAQLRRHALAASKPALLLQGFAEAAERSLAEMRAKFDGAVLERAVDLLSAADTLYLLGLRRSYPITSYMAYAFGKLGVKCVLIGGTGGLAPESLRFSGAGDALLAVSFAPYASDTVALAAATAARGVPIVAITDGPFSPLAQSASLWLEVAEADFEGFRCMAATLTLAMTLTVAVAEQRGGR